MDEYAIARVRALVDAVPAGRVVTYGDVGRAVGLVPRVVGAIMRDHADGLPWWRVVSRAGVLPEHLAERARAHWRAEGVPLAGDGVRLEECRLPAGEITRLLFEM